MTTKEESAWEAVAWLDPSVTRPGGLTRDPSTRPAKIEGANSPPASANDTNNESGETEEEDFSRSEAHSAASSKSRDKFARAR